MLVTESRPRTLKWFHAGPLLYGDWGTSRLYVLGLAFLYTAHASVLYLAAIGLLMVAVSWAYTIVCRSFPDGGGVYTAARQLSPTASVIGATMLLSGYVMTVAISVVEAFHYFGVSHDLTLPLGIGAILLVGGVNWLGARSAGRFALVVAFGALAVSAVLVVFSVPFFFEGVRTISFGYLAESTPGEAWISFTRICLALAGVEAVANMTGLMRPPVARTARRTIWPVTVEVVALNLVFGIALAGLPSLVETHTPDADTYQRELDMTPAQVRAQVEAGTVTAEHAEGVEQARAYRDTAMKVIATETGSSWFGPQTGRAIGIVAGVTFGLLLLSATNTAVMATVSVLFAMAQDRELPRALTRLNYSGVPWVGLIAAVAIPIGVIAVEQNPQNLAKLYVLGVCGAITVSVLSVAMNRKLDVSGGARVGLWALGSLLAAITATIAATQLASLAFTGGLVCVVLALREAMAFQRRRRPEPLPTPEAGWLAEVRVRTVDLDPSRPRIMLAARGRYQSEFAVDLARRRGAILFAVYVRTLRVMDLRAGRVPTIEDDSAAQEALGTTAVLARDARVPFVPIYVTSDEIAEEILDHTVTYGCDTLIMGKSRRSVFARRLEGDVVARVAEHLPDGVALITRSADKPHRPSGRAG